MALGKCTVLIWQGDAENIGHAALRLGSVAPFTEVSDEYVSWWPDGEAGPQSLLPGVRHPGTGGLFQDDWFSEGGRSPEVEIEIDCLDLDLMKAEWKKIRDKPDAHYRLLRKNCCTTVARVLRAGGGAELVSWAKAHNALWTKDALTRFARGIAKMNMPPAPKLARTERTRNLFPPLPPTPAK